MTRFGWNEARVTESKDANSEDGNREQQISDLRGSDEPKHYRD